MGLGDQISRIVIDVKAETKGARQSLHELNGALDAMGKFARFAREAINDYGEHTRLASATAGINVEKLSKSFRGLINEHDLLTFASRTANGAFKLNQAEMEKVGQAAIALRNRGFDLNDAISKLTNAMVKGKAEGLDDFGLSIENADTKAGRLKNIMVELDRVVKESGESTGEYADDVAKLANEWDNVTAALKRYMVEALKGVRPEDLLKEGYNQIARGNGTRDGGGSIYDATIGGAGGDPMAAFLNGFDDANNAASMRRTQANFGRGIGIGKQNVLDRDKLDPEALKKQGDAAAAAAKKAADAARQAAELAAREAEEYRKLGLALLGVESASARAIRVGEEMRTGQAAELALVSQLESAYSLNGLKRYAADMEQLRGLVDEGKISWDAFGLARQKAWEGAGGDGLADGDVDFVSTKERLAQARAGIADMRNDIEAQGIAKAKGRQTSVLTTLFGEHDEVDIWIESFQRLGAVFTGFGEAVGSSYEAIVTGQGSASAAFKKTLADSLLATGKESSIKAIQQLALAAGSAAYGNFPQASLHLKSAALHGAVALAAGAAANQLGTSSQVAASEKAAAEKTKEEEKAKKDREKAEGKGGGSSGSDKDRPIYILVGEAFGDSSLRQRRIHAEDAMAKALRERDE